MDLLQCLMDSSSHAIFTLDRDGIITHINQQAKVRFGLYHNSQHPHSNAGGKFHSGFLLLLIWPLCEGAPAKRVGERLWHGLPLRHGFAVPPPSQREAFLYANCIT